MSPLRALFSRSPDRNYFKYHKIFIYVTLALCLPVVANAWFSKSYFSLLLVPTSILFSFLFSFKKYFFIAVELKIYSDMLLVIIVFLSGEMDRLPLSGSVYTSFFVYIFINLFILRSRLLFAIALLYACLPFIGSYFFQVGNFFLFGCLSLLSIFIALLFRLAKEQDDLSRALKQKELETRYREISDFYKITKLNEDLLVHDCKNILQGIFQIELEHQTGKCSDKALATALTIKARILEKLDLISGRSKSEIQVAATVVEILSQTFESPKHFHVSIPESFRIIFNPKLFESLIYNLLKNAREAWMETHDDLNDFFFQVSLDHSWLCLEDNAGGFDPTHIRKGGTTKALGNGEFLHLLTQNANELGLRVVIERTSTGMRFRILFSS